MKRIEGFNIQALQAVMKVIPGTMRDWASATGVGFSTYSGWKNGKQKPRRDSWELFKNYLVELQDRDRELVFEAILDACKIKDNDPLKKQLKRLYQSDFKVFVDYMVWHFQIVNRCVLEQLDKEVLDDILRVKLQRWLSKEQGCVLEKVYSEKGYSVFGLSIQNEKQKPLWIFLGYSFASTDSAVLKHVLKYLQDIYENILCSIFVLTTEIDNVHYQNYVRSFRTYCIRITDADIEALDNSFWFVDVRKNDISSDELLQLNVAGEVLYRKMRMRAYLVYKELMCYEYDENISENFFASNKGIGQYPYAMRRAISFEKKRIEKELLELKRNRGVSDDSKLDIMIDLNCISGIYGLRLFQHVKQVICSDTSRRAMETLQELVCQYNKCKKAENPGIMNVNIDLFREETLEMMGNEDLTGRVDCVILGLGSFSFVDDPDALLLKIRSWLKKDGFLFLTCYNADALSIILDKYMNLNYTYDAATETLSFERKMCTWTVPVKMYTFHELLSYLSRYFAYSDEKRWSYPVISSVVDVNYCEQGQDIIKEVDKASAVSNHQSPTHGIYNIFTLTPYQKPETHDFYVMTNQKVQEMNIAYTLISHNKFYSEKSLRRILNEKGIIIVNNFIKCIVLKDNCGKTPRYLMVLLLVNEKLSKAALQTYYMKKNYRYSSDKVRFCTEKELVELGFTQGSISPFSYLVLREQYETELLCDVSVKEMRYDVIYTCTGSCNSTYKIKWDDFNQYLERVDAVSMNLK